MADLRSIRLTGYGQLNTKELILNYGDVNKLDLFSDTGEGSTAFCADTSQLFIKHENEWKNVVVEIEEGLM